jgi:hypothetical protein
MAMESRSFGRREERLARIREDAQKQSALETTFGQRLPASAQKALPDGSYYGLPVLKKPAWSWEVPVYFFTGGAAGAASVLASVAKWKNADERFIRDAQWIAAIGGAVSPALLISDLGMPSRFLNMMRVFKFQSPMSVGSWTLMAFSSSAVATLMLAEFERRTGRQIPLFAEMAPAMSVLSGLVLATYTGVLVGATAIPAWNENVDILPVHFAASGLAAASAILELRGHTQPAVRRLAVAAAAVETVTGATLEIRNSPGTEPLRRGSSGWAMRTAGLLSGPLPLLLRTLAIAASPERGRKLRRAAAISSLTGSLVTRWAWVHAGRVSARDSRPALAAPKQPRELVGVGKSEAPALKTRSMSAGG